ncbi:MAG: hotdog fold domain-containing protein [Salinisphaeraceae bacterium]|nr:hotdog fold domain-containing protein [Salinisphaeraceae bacterium]
MSTNAMSTVAANLKLYQSCERLPLGKQLFSRALCFKAPFFSSISPVVNDLKTNRCEVRIRKRRKVQNHIGTVHAIAMCNMAELAGGLVTDVSIPTTHRWIPKGMTVEYLKKAETDLVAIGTPEGQAAPNKGAEYPVVVEVKDTSGDLVFRARISMWVSPKK